MEIDMDIVERLRSVTRLLRKTEETSYEQDCTLASEAADEIERLREALEPFAKLGEKYLKDADASVQDNIDKWEFVVQFSDLVAAYEATQKRAIADAI